MSKTVGTVLAAARLPESDTAQLDAEVLLAHVLDKPRAWLLAHPDQVLTTNEHATFDELLKRRAKQEPVAYLIGHQEFYGRDFLVTPDVLVPRPESEQLVELALSEAEDGETVIDIGTGSGCLAVTLKLERPSLEVIGSDISSAALTVARHNGQQLRAEITWVEHDLCPPLRDPARTVVVANLPYCPTEQYQKSPSIQAEPTLALDGGSDGFAVIERLLESLTEQFPRCLLLEMDPSHETRLVERFGARCRIASDLRGKRRFAVIQA